MSGKSHRVNDWLPFVQKVQLEHQNERFLQYKQKMQEWLAGMEHVRLLRERCSSLGGSTASIEVRYQSASDAQRVRAATAAQAQADEQARKRRESEEQERLRRRQQSDRDKM